MAAVAKSEVPIIRLLEEIHADAVKTCEDASVAGNTS